MGRKIVNISLPQKLKKEVDRVVKNGFYSSRSEFFRHLMRLWEEEKLLNDIRESQKEILHGKGNVLKSLKKLR